jgi:hypothetical protein
MIILPTFIALAALWWNGHLGWACWVVSLLGLFAWLCGHAMLNARNDLQRGVTSDRRVYDFWMLFASFSIWAQWLVCLAAIILAIVVR